MRIAADGVEMNNCAVFADVSNLYYCVGKRFDGRKLDYQKLYQKASEIGDVQRAFAYGSQVGDEANPFITCLKKIGYDTKYRRPKISEDNRIVRKVNWDVGIAMDIVRMTPRINTVILCSADEDLAPLVQWVRDQGVRCVVLACGISRLLKEVADSHIEITEELLEDVRQVAA